MEKTTGFALKEAYDAGYQDGISSVVKASEEDFKLMLSQARNGN